MSSLDDQLQADLEQREKSCLRRSLRVVPPGVLDLAANDYLGLSQHPAVIEAACEATRNYGAGARASRLVSGHIPLHTQLEEELAAFKGCEASLVFPSGYQANLSLITSLAGEQDVLLCDKRNHASLIDAVRLAGQQNTTVRFYDSWTKLRALLERYSQARQRFVVTDAVFSMDGDVVDLPQLFALACEFEAYIILDDAHGTGTLGLTGRGAMEHYGLKNEAGIERFIQMGTLSKAVGSQGGFVAGSRLLIEWLVNAARPFIYTTGLNPAACGAALAALKIIQGEPQHLARLREVTQRLASGLIALGFAARQQPSPIIPVIVGDEQPALALSDALLRHGVWCPAIRPPTVPGGTSRLRVTASAALNDSEIDRILDVFNTTKY
ncbi:MAG: 8-amino-7-oxononanoate synthase [Abitibacteriaceae bacterium]|nr:8-amino-7-oxononanoate synthase [Abditibacteriaceae bacterium]